MPDNNPPDIFDFGRTQGPSAPPTPLRETAQWHVAAGGKKGGPFTTAQIKKGLAAGKIPRSALVWKEGMAEWTPVGQIPQLVPAAGSAPPPLPDADTGRPEALDTGPAPLAPTGDEFDAGATRMHGNPVDEAASAARPPSGASGPQPALAASAEAASQGVDFPLGHILDNKFLITRKLGQGGMGAVYRVTERDDTGVEYAIKVLAPALIDDPQALADL